MLRLLRKLTVRSPSREVVSNELTMCDWRQLLWEGVAVTGLRVVAIWSIWRRTGSAGSWQLVATTTTRMD